jgi:hypothetical protein
VRYWRKPLLEQKKIAPLQFQAFGHAVTKSEQPVIGQRAAASGPSGGKLCTPNNMASTLDPVTQAGIGAFAGLVEVTAQQVRRFGTSRDDYRHVSLFLETTREATFFEEAAFPFSRLGPADPTARTKRTHDRFKIVTRGNAYAVARGGQHEKQALLRCGPGNHDDDDADNPIPQKNIAR